MGIGLSFGKKTQSGSGTSNIDKTTDLTGTQNSDKTTSGTTNTATTGSTTTNQQQTGVTSQVQDQTSAGKTAQSQTGTVKTLGQDVQDALSAKIKGVLGGGISDASISALDAAILGRAAPFDEAGYVGGVVGQARNRGEQVLQENMSSFGNRAGGTADTNTMAALMQQRGRNDLEANLGGIEAQARAAAAGISNQNLATASGAAGGLAGIAQALAGSLKGGTTETDMTSLTDQINQLMGKNTGTTSESTTGQQNTSTNSQTEQLLRELATMLTDQTQREVGSEQTTQKGKSGGFGLSLGL